MLWKSLVLLAVLLSGPAEDEPKLVLSAPRVGSLLPGLAAKGYGKRVDVRARLEGEPEHPEEIYCLDELWDWGDGTESVREPDCDPYDERAEIERDFHNAHHFRPGGYAITLRLSRRGTTVAKGTIDVRIY